MNNRLTGLIAIAGLLLLDGVLQASPADTTSIEKNAWRKQLSASLQAVNSPKAGAPQDTTANPDGFWLQLHSAFPQNGPIIMAARDWLRQDKLHPNSPPALFEQKTREHLLWTEKTLAYAKREGADTAANEDALKSLAAVINRQGAGDWRELYFDLRILRRRILFSHPALNFDQILINVNPPTTYSHNGDQFLGRHSRTGKGLILLSGWKGESPEVKCIVKGKLPEGAYRDPDLSYDTKKVLFAFCDHSTTDKHLRRYWIYEAALDGSWCRQVTGTSRDPLQTWGDRATVLIEDNDPCYLPDGDILLLSTRSQTFGRCHGGRYNPAWVLYRCNVDGSEIRQLSYGNENEVEPSILNDGRIAFTRWEYTDRHEMFFHKLWTCRPDGTFVAHLFGNDMIVPHQFVEVSAIPDSHKIVATAQGHHSFNTGTIVVIDPNVADNGETAITRITPETSYSETHGWPSPHYSHPYPVNEQLFLASRANHPVSRQGSVPPAEDRGIYLIDPLGGREQIYEDPEMASFSPIAVRPRKPPPQISPVTAASTSAESYGTVFLQNAYLTRNDPEGKIKPGMIKALRITALGVQPRAAKQGISPFAHNNIPKKILGTVPVDEDGSAFFRVPAGTSIQVQTLDENGMAILTERSFFYLQPGENRSCIGCHEPYGTPPDMSKLSKTGKMKLMDLKPPAGPAYKGGLSFTRTVQPVLDRYCISCHGLGGSDDPRAASLNLIGSEKPGFSAAYRKLAALGDSTVGSKPDMGSLERNISRPRDYYAYRNKLPHMLLKNHGQCDLESDSFMRIVEWLDANSPFYGDLFPNKLEDRILLDESAAQTQALREYVKDLFGEAIAAQPIASLINRVQVDESRILMAPLAIEAGGWGKMTPQWASRSSPEYKKMAALADACIQKDPNENTNGWSPTLNQGAGEPWVMEAREALKNSLKAKEQDTH